MHLVINHALNYHFNPLSFDLSPPPPFSFPFHSLEQKPNTHTYSRMMLGKRSRQPIKRTTSMTGITVDVSDAEDVLDHHQDPIISHPQIHPLHESPHANSPYDQRFLAMVSPRNPASFTSHANDSSTTAAAPFLRACWLCNRRLAPGRDIYMYRGDTAFCSQECREKQMKQDERKEKLDINASKKEDRHAHSSSTTTTSKTSKAKPVVAA